MASKQRLLVTGGAGFIGSAFVRHRLRSHPGSPIRVLDALTYAGDARHLAGLDGEVELVVGDVAERSHVEAAMDGCSGVVHFAAESHVDRSLRDKDPFERTNVEGTSVLLQAASKAEVSRFLLVSTDEVYGDVSGKTRKSLETDPPHPGNPYAASKARAEALVLEAAANGMDTCITRGANTCGPRQYPEKVVPLFVTNALLGLNLPVYGAGTARRDWLHVDDHCSGIDRVFEHGKAGEVYNLGSRTATSTMELAQIILNCVGKTNSEIVHVADRPGHDLLYAVDPSRAESLGWSPLHDPVSAIADTVRWYVKHEDWWRQARASEHFQTHLRAWYIERQA